MSSLFLVITTQSQSQVKVIGAGGGVSSGGNIGDSDGENMLTSGFDISLYGLAKYSSLYHPRSTGKLAE